MPDVHRALEQLEAFHAELIRPSDAELKYAIEKVIAIFKTNLFNALVDIQEFYDNTLLNDRISFVQKCIASRRFAEKWEQNPPFSSGYTRTSIPVTAVKPNYDTYSLGRTPSLNYAVNYPVTASTPLTNGFLSKSYSPNVSYKPKNFIVDEQGREWEVEEINLDTSLMGLGFSISGGIDRDPDPDYYIRVTEILPDGVVARDGRVKLQDVILRVNNVDCVNVPHETAVKALQIAGPIVNLLIKRLKNFKSLSQSHLADTVYRRTEEERAWGTIGSAPVRSRSLHQLPLPSYLPYSQPAPPSIGSAVSPILKRSPIPPPHQPLLTQTPQRDIVPLEIRNIVLRKSDGGLGFNIVGGEDNEPIFISHVLPGGVADLSGNVRKGDALLRVNDVDLARATHNEAALALRALPQNSFVHLQLQFRPREYHEFEDKVERLRKDMLEGRFSRNQ